MQGFYLNVAENFESYNFNISTFLSVEQQEELNNDYWWVNLFPTDSDYVTLQEFIFRLFGAFVCVLLILTTLIGNILVIVVVIRFNRMRTVTNILLASLASADITVALLVMPFMVIYDFIRKWPFGAVACHLWISCDVMCCTSSILHLCCVAIDRFCAITRPLRYRTFVSKRRLFCCITIIWLCSAVISFIPIFAGWYHDGTVKSIFSMDDTPNCSLKVNRVYAVISSLTSFYLPLPIMFYVYFRILLVAEKQAREIRQLELSLQQNGLLFDPSQTGLSDTGSLGNNSDTSDVKRHVERNLKRRARQLITDTKAIRTLGIVMGVFCLCWLPFFIMYVLSAYCVNCDISYEVRSGITWLGYVNSALNPCIYAYLNKEFKNAYKRVLCCMPRIMIEGERDAMMDEISTTSRSLQRMERLHVGIELPPTPGMISRTPSATPELHWPIISNNTLSPSSGPSRNPSISTYSDTRK